MILNVLGIQFGDFYLFSQHFILFFQLFDDLFLPRTVSSSFGFVLAGKSAGTGGIVSAVADTAVVLVRLSREEAGLAVGLQDMVRLAAVLQNWLAVRRVSGH